MDIIIIIFIALIALISFYLGNNEDNALLLFVAFLLLFAFCLLFIAIDQDMQKNEGYKQGYIDAKTGKKAYTLEIQPDSTKIWVKTK